MIDQLAGTGQNPPAGKIFEMVTNPRMAGGVPAWVKADSHVSAYKSPGDNTAAARTVAPDSEFGFFDLLDIINPLQHIPLVNLAYRRITGDEIKSAPQVIGGAVFGGPIGAASNLVNIVIQEETGRGIAENALALVSPDAAPKKAKTMPDDPETRLAAVLSGNSGGNELPASLLAFTDTGTRLHLAAQKSSGDSPESFSPYEIY